MQEGAVMSVKGPESVKEKGERLIEREVAACV